MKNNKTFTTAQINDIIYKQIQKIMKNKDRYIELNGYSHKDTLMAFDIRIAAIMEMYSLFE